MQITISLVEKIINSSRERGSRFAVWAMRIFGSVPQLVDIFKNHRDPVVRLDFFRSLLTLPRDMEICRPCPILGPASPTLQPKQRSIIENILTVHWMDWQRNQSPIPQERDVYKDGMSVTAERLAKTKLVIVQTKYTNANPACIASDFYAHLTSSARCAGLDVYVFDADEIHYDHNKLESKPKPTRPLAEALGDLSNFLERVRPDIVMSDGNFVPTENTVDAAFWVEQRKKLGFKHVLYVPDCFDGFSDVNPWLPCIDFIITFNDTAYQILGLDHVAVVPSMPFNAAFFKPDQPKDLGVVCIGTNSRGRATWMGALAILGVPSTSFLHDRLTENARTLEEYCDLMSRAKIVFNTGALNSMTYVTTGRFSEGIISGALVLEEAGARADLYYVPYVHYIPVTNFDQAVAFSQFFIESESWRKIITDAAQDYQKTYYSSDKFWRFLVARTLPE